jgi:hypothetical protein
MTLPVAVARHGIAHFIFRCLFRMEGPRRCPTSPPYQCGSAVGGYSFGAVEDENAQIIGIQVVPSFGGAMVMTYPDRGVYPAPRLLSARALQ